MKESPSSSPSPPSSSSGSAGGGQDDVGGTVIKSNGYVFIKSCELHLEEDPDRPPITLHPLFGAQGFVLKNVLSKAECAQFIAQAESMGLDEIQLNKKEYRNCLRCSVMGPEVSPIIWQRIAPFIDNILVTAEDDQRVGGTRWDVEGEWVPDTLNVLWRLCKYEDTGHFGPHYDAAYMKDPNHRSLKTFMLYLNDDFEGGTTNFVDEKQSLFQDEQGLYRAQEENITHRVVPEPGMALIFNHGILHEGGALTSGLKYIMRTDLMFTRPAGSQLSETEARAMLLYEEAQTLESSMLHQQAAEKYRQAFKLAPDLEEKLFARGSCWLVGQDMRFIIV